MKLKNNTYLSLTVDKRMIRSNFDYIFIPLLTDTQRIRADIQKLQNRVLRTIHHFPLKTSVNKIHKKLKIDLLETRLYKLFDKFIVAKNNHELIQQEIQVYEKNPNPRFITLFDIIIRN